MKKTIKSLFAKREQQTIGKSFRLLGGKDFSAKSNLVGLRFECVEELFDALEKGDEDRAASAIARSYRPGTTRVALYLPVEHVLFLFHELYRSSKFLRVLDENSKEVDDLQGRIESLERTQSSLSLALESITDSDAREDLKEIFEENEEQLDELKEKREKLASSPPAIAGREQVRKALQIALCELLARSSDFSRAVHEQLVKKHMFFENITHLSDRVEKLEEDSRIFLENLVFIEKNNLEDEKFLEVLREKRSELEGDLELAREEEKS